MTNDELRTTSNAVTTARSFLERHFPDAVAAFVAGSFLRGEATATSDLDIVVIVEREEAPFRASHHEFGWPIEVFVHTRESYRWYFTSGADLHTASLQRMCAEGVVLRDQDGVAERIKQEAQEQLERGPEPLAAEELESRRYGLTDLLDDFIGCDRQDEGIFIAAMLAERAVHLILLRNRSWIGYGKWVLRSLRLYDPVLADRLEEAMTSYARTNEKEKLVRFAQDALEEAGGRLFEGYYSRGQRS